MEKTSHWAALYFVALMTFGNYVLFNLLVAILVEGFSSEVSSGWRWILGLNVLHFFEIKYHGNGCVNVNPPVYLITRRNA